MRKFIRIKIIIGFLLLFLVLLFTDVFSLKKILHLNINEKFFEPTLDEMQNTYLKLLGEYKKLMPYRETHTNESSKSTPGLIRDPFEIPKIKINKNDKHLDTKTSTKVHNLGQNRLTLYGILWDAKSPLAIIGDKIVHVGSDIGSYKVTQILPREVVLSSRQKTMVLRMPSPRFNVQ